MDIIRGSCGHGTQGRLLYDRGVIQTRRPPGPSNFVPGRTLYRMSRDIVGFFSYVQKVYGDVAYFRIGRRKIYLLSHPDHIRDVLVTHAENFTKGPALRLAKVTLGEGLLTSEGDFHRRQRRLMQSAFHAQRVADYADVFVGFANRARERWTEGEVFDIRAAITQLTLEIVAKTLFDAQIESEVRELGEAMDVTVTMFDRSRYPWAKLLNLLPLKSNYRFLRAKDRVFETIDRMIARRRADAGAAKKDFLSILLRARDAEGDGRGMSDEQLRFEAMTLFSAGHETTANALVWTWWLLAQNPEAEARLHEELDRMLDGRAPTAADVPRLTYTRAVLAESMRLYPPAWIIGRQATAAHRAGDWTIPPQGVILMSQFLVHRDPRWWNKPDKFDPSRWLDGNEATRPRYAYFPFGGGPRQCIGEAFAWLEGILLIATLAQRWKFSLVEQPPVRLHATITLRPKDPLMMRVSAV
jgi:cytochrome P450